MYSASSTTARDGRREPRAGPWGRWRTWVHDQVSCTRSWLALVLAGDNVLTVVTAVSQVRGRRWRPGKVSLFAASCLVLISPPAAPSRTGCSLEIIMYSVVYSHQRFPPAAPASNTRAGSSSRSSKSTRGSRTPTCGPSPASSRSRRWEVPTASGSPAGLTLPTSPR